MHKVMSFPEHVRALLKLGLPLVGGFFAHIAITLTDTIMLGWYSVEALAAVALAGSAFFIIFILGSGYGIAVMPLVAEADAQDDQVTIRRVSRMGMWLSVLFGIIAMPVFIWSGPILTALGQEPITAIAAQDYLWIVGPSLFPALIVMVLKSYLAALEHTRVVFWVTVAAAIANAIVNYILIFGNFGAPELGIRGAAIASCATQIVLLLGTIIYALKVFPQHNLFQRIWKPDTEALSSVFRLGTPIGITNLAESGLFTATTIMMGWLGTIPLAAHGIAQQISAMGFMVHLGLSSAATVRAGNALGRKDVDHLARGALATTVVSTVVAILTMLIFFAFPAQLLGFFIDPGDPRRAMIIAVGVPLLYIAALFQLVDGLQAVALGLLRGVKDTRAPMYIAAFSYWGVGLTTGYVFGFVFNWGGVGVWTGLVVGLGMAAILLHWRFWGPKLRELRARFAEES